MTKEKRGKGQQNPGDRIVDRQIPVSNEKTDAVAEIHPAVKPVINGKGHREIKCHPEGRLKASIRLQGF